MSKGRKGVRADLFDGTDGIDHIGEIPARMHANCPRPRSTSTRLWELRHATNLAGRNRSNETMLERAVAMLAANGHMPGWFNQCPAASGIGDSSLHKHRSVDLVHWIAPDARLTLVELKWASDRPADAVRQILRYGAAYLFCRMHSATLPVANRAAMTASHVALRIVAPARYYKDGDLSECIGRAREGLGGLDGRPGLSGLGMSLDALAFPEWLDRLPFACGAETRDSCGGPQLTENGRTIVDAFNDLTPVSRV